MSELKTNRLSSAEVRQYNKRLIFRTLLQTESATKQEISVRTHLSIPKITQVLNELTAQNLVQTSGIQASSGGRRPEAFCVRLDYYMAAGIDITRHHLNFSVIDLRGKIVVNQRISEDIDLDEKFYLRIYNRFMQFLGEQSVNYNKLIGIGISLPGIISPDNDFLAYSHVMQISKPFDLRPLRDSFNVPVTFFNDANAACMAECYTGHTPSSFNFLSLSNSVGGAVVIDRKLVSGTSGRAGEPGHIMIVPDGRQCYCGKKGHYDAYGSALILSEAADGSLADFFAGLRSGNQSCKQIFNEYIYYLALLITNLHLWSDLPIVLGGYAASFLAPYLEQIKAEIEKMSIFSENNEYLYISSYHYEASSIGCARYYVEAFIDSL